VYRRIKSRPVLVLVFSAAFAVACGRDTHSTVDHGTFLLPEGEPYTVVILQEEFLRRAFGGTLQRRRLYYGYSGGFMNGAEVATRPDPLGTLSLHPPVLVIAGNRWNRDLGVLIYDAASDEQILLGLNLPDPSIRLKRPRHKRGGLAEQRLLDDGRLSFRAMPRKQAAPSAVHKTQ
jgi:hypothetical protein